MGEMISFAGNGHEYQGYLAAAEGGAGPGVIVIQEWWGLVDHIKAICDRFAAAGFTALAPDLYEGESTDKPDQAGKLMMALNIASTEQALKGAVEALAGHPATRGDKVGVVGFCMGGQLAMFAAANNARVGACVNFYGIHPHVQVDYSGLSGPVMGFFAENDDFVSADVVAKVLSEVTAAGKRIEVHRYLDTSHAFFNDTRPEVYHEASAADAWQKTRAFFAAQL